MTTIAETDKQLLTLIQVGDVLELFNEQIVTARHVPTIRHDTIWYTAFLSVWSEGFGMPVELRAINAVYRGDACLWRRGITPTQKGLWE